MLLIVTILFECRVYVFWVNCKVWIFVDGIYLLMVFICGWYLLCGWYLFVDGIYLWKVFYQARSYFTLFFFWFSKKKNEHKNKLVKFYRFIMYFMLFNFFFYFIFLNISVFVRTIRPYFAMEVISLFFGGCKCLQVFVVTFFVIFIGAWMKTFFQNLCVWKFSPSDEWRLCLKKKKKRKKEKMKRMEKKTKKKEKKKAKKKENVKKKKKEERKKEKKEKKK